MKDIIKVTIEGRPTANDVYQYKKKEKEILSAPPPKPNNKPMQPIRKTNEDESFWNRPHCPNCDYRLTHWSNAYNDEVFDKVDKCPYCNQLLLW